jgi:hypothetical protein
MPKLRSKHLQGARYRVGSTPLPPPSENRPGISPYEAESAGISEALSGRVKLCKHDMEPAQATTTDVAVGCIESVASEPWEQPEGPERFQVRQDIVEEREAMVQQATFVIPISSAPWPSRSAATALISCENRLAFLDEPLPMIIPNGSPQRMAELRREQEHTIDRMVRNLRDASDLARPKATRDSYLPKQDQFRVRDSEEK